MLAACRPLQDSITQEKLEKAGTVDFEKTPRAEGGHKVPGSVDPMFAKKVCLSRCPELANSEHFAIREIFSRYFPGISRNSPPKLPKRPRNSHSLLELSE